MKHSAHICCIEFSTHAEWNEMVVSHYLAIVRFSFIITRLIPYRRRAVSVGGAVRFVSFVRKYILYMLYIARVCRRASTCTHICHAYRCVH